MPSVETLADYLVADTVYRHVIDRAVGRVGLVAFPASLQQVLVLKRTGLKALPYIDAIPDAGDPPSTAVDLLVHLKLVGDWYPGAFSQGRTMRTSASNDRFVFESQETVENAGVTTVVTRLKSAEGLGLEHHLAWFDSDAAVEITTAFHNGSTLPVTLEMLTSFSLGGLTPFDAADAPSKLEVHRFRSVWSAEG